MRLSIKLVFLVLIGKHHLVISFFPFCLFVFSLWRKLKIYNKFKFSALVHSMTRVSSGRRSSFGSSSTTAEASSSSLPVVQTPVHSTGNHSVGSKDTFNSLSNNEKKRKSISKDEETPPSKSPSSSTVTPRNRSRISLPLSAVDVSTPSSLVTTGLPSNLSQFSDSLVEQLIHRYSKDSKLKGVPNVS
jgi:hypothetical protein